MAATATRKQPQDHKPKADAPRTVTVRGETFTIPADALDDFELLGDLGRIQEGEAALLPNVLRRLVGDDGYRRAMDALRGENGRVSVSDGAEFVGEILTALDPNS